MTPYLNVILWTLRRLERALTQQNALHSEPKEGPTDPPQRNGDRRRDLNWPSTRQMENCTPNITWEKQSGVSRQLGGGRHRRRNGKREVVITPCTSQSAQQEPDGVAHCPGGGRAGAGVGPGLTGPWCLLTSSGSGATWWEPPLPAHTKKAWAHSYSPGPTRTNNPILNTSSIHSCTLAQIHTFIIMFLHSDTHRDTHTICYWHVHPSTMKH